MAATAITPTHPTPSTDKSSQSIEAQELEFGQAWDGAGQAQSPVITRPNLELCGRRKSSVAFHTAGAEETIRRESIINPPPKVPSRESKRMSSPPPPSHYSRGVSFDTFDNKEATDESFTLIYKHRDYASSARSRTFLCGTDAKDYSEYALEWMMDELVDDGDEIVCLRVIEKEDKPAILAKYRREAEKLLDSVKKKNSSEDKAISMIMELAVGRVQEVFQRMIGLYEPLHSSSEHEDAISAYCLQHSPVPVIVVRPSSKRMKKKMKRQQESGRSLYTTLTQQAAQTGGRHLRDNSIVESPPTAATDQEAEAVAKAISQGRRKGGILKNYNYGGPLQRVTSNPSDVASDEEDPATSRFALPIGYLTTEEAPRADLAMQSRESVAAPGGKTERSGSDAFMSSAGEEEEAEDDGFLNVGPAKIVEHRRPSMRETTPWLADILRDKPAPRNRSRSRSRNRDPSLGRSPARGSR
ncbi:Universal stress protein A family protein C25B2.10 [Cyphellophora attinorum]|uniref:Universal stress protein A family protein C25B2.10 n=1 Tax=Cyphellophora attinorum TaxID=1664694 RepID=A0A0N1HDD9_9EURO|nr:Universal stress protein A family protein C25B2.10 [Phialophora attinorum]KPI42362.1 Universal stress protein A family protein C25B2.10 [Phialophora attinorum]